MRKLHKILPALLAPVALSAQVLVVVDSVYYNDNSYDIQGKNRVERYVEEVKSIDGVHTDLHVYGRSHTSELDNVKELWGELVEKYNTSLDDGDTITGIVMIGNVPKPVYHNDDYAYSSCDNVYMELWDNSNSVRYTDTSDFDSIWVKDPQGRELFINDKPYRYGKYKPTSPTYSQHNYYDLWVSRIYAANLTQLRLEGAPWGTFLSEHQILSNYLDKIHERMTQPANKPSRALGFGDIEDYRKWHASLDTIGTSDQFEPSDALMALCHKERLAVNHLPVDTSFYIYNFDENYTQYPNTGDKRINSASNWQSQLQKGPYGNENKGQSTVAINNKYDVAPVGAPTLAFDESDTLGYEWVGILEHGSPHVQQMNGVHGVAGGDISRGSFVSRINNEAPDDEGFKKIIDNDPLCPYYYTTIRDLYPVLNTPQHPTALNWSFDEFADGDIVDIYLWVDPAMINAGKQYTNIAWMNVDQTKYENDDFLREGQKGAKVKALDFVNSNGAGWYKVISNINIVPNSVGFNTSFHATHYDDSVMTDEFPLRAVKAVSSSGAEYVKTLTHEDFSFDFLRPNDRVLTKMQEDGGQSKAHYFMLNNCSISNFAHENNIGLTYAMAHDGLTSLGASKTNYATVKYGNYVEALANGSSFGDAFTKIYRDRNVGWNLFGAGTLKSEPYVAFRHPDSCTEAEMLSFDRIGAWVKERGNASIEQKEDVQNGNDRHYKVTVWSGHEVQLASKLPINQLKGSGVKAAKIGLTISFPKTPVNPYTQNYRGNLQILFNNSWVGQFELNTNGGSVVVDSTGEMCHAYYEFAIPTYLANNLNEGLDNFKIRFSSIRDGEWFLLKDIKFTNNNEEFERDLDEEFQKLVDSGYTSDTTVYQLKRKSAEYPNHSSVGIVYRKMVDPVDGKMKYFYYRLGYADDMSMLWTNWWSAHSAYAPNIPWVESPSHYWRQVWIYMGCVKHIN